MKKFLILLLFFPLNLLAQTNGEIMDRVRSEFSGEKAYRMNFTIASDEDCYAMTGILTLQGYRYKIETDNLEIYCDAESKWVVYPDYREAMIMLNDLHAVDFIENPYIILTAPEEIFRFKEKSRAEKTGTGYRVAMEARDKHSYDLEIFLTSGYMPERIVLNGENASYTVEVISVDGIPAPEIDFFRFETDDPDFYVTDMR